MTAHRLPAGALVLAGEDLRLVVAVLRGAQAARTRAGVPPHAQIDALVRLAGGVTQDHPTADVSAPMAATGQTDTDAEGDGHHGFMSTTEAATVLGCSERQARRLARDLGGRRVGGRWLVARDAVLERRDGRA